LGPPGASPSACAGISSSCSSSSSPSDARQRAKLHPSVDRNPVNGRRRRATPPVGCPARHGLRHGPRLPDLMSADTKNCPWVDTATARGRPPRRVLLAAGGQPFLSQARDRRLVREVQIMAPAATKGPHIWSHRYSVVHAA